MPVRLLLEGSHPRGRRVGVGKAGAAGRAAAAGGSGGPCPWARAGAAWVCAPVLQKVLIKNGTYVA